MSRRTFGETWWGRAWIDALEGIAGGSDRPPQPRPHLRPPGPGRGPHHPARRRHRVRAGHRARPLRGVPRRPRLPRRRVGHGVRRHRRQGRPRRRAARRRARSRRGGGRRRGRRRAAAPGPRPAHRVLVSRRSSIRASTRPPLCYLVADALDADPFVLLLLRGRRRDEVLDGVRAAGVPAPTRRLSTPGGDMAPAREGIDAAEAWSRDAAPPPDRAARRERPEPAGGVAERTARARPVRRPRAAGAGGRRRPTGMGAVRRRHRHRPGLRRACRPGPPGRRRLTGRARPARRIERASPPSSSRCWPAAWQMGRRRRRASQRRAPLDPAAARDGRSPRPRHRHRLRRPPGPHQRQPGHRRGPASSSGAAATATGTCSRSPRGDGRWRHHPSSTSRTSSCASPHA